MRDEVFYRMLADVVLTLHVAVVLFVIGGLLVVVVGNLRNWHWVNALWCRLAHLAAIGFVVVLLVLIPGTLSKVGAVDVLKWLGEL